VSNILAWATSAGWAGRAHASERLETGGTIRGRGTQVGSGATTPTSREIDNTHRSSTTFETSATPPVHRPVKFRTLPVTVHSLRAEPACEVPPPRRAASTRTTGRR
jgi:hypothetical protein